MDWTKIDHFKASEFPSEEEINLTDQRLFWTLDAYREDLGYIIHPLQAWICALHHFAGMGVYFDTHYKNRKWIMLHGDLRTGQRLWRRDNGIYSLIQTEQDIEDLIERLK